MSSYPTIMFMVTPHPIKSMPIHTDRTFMRIILAMSVSTGSVNVALNLTYLNAFMILRIALIAEVLS